MEAFTVIVEGWATPGARAGAAPQATSLGDCFSSLTISNYRPDNWSIGVDVCEYKRFDDSIRVLLM